MNQREALKKKIEDLEERIKELESRPIVVQFPAVYQPQPAYLYWPHPPHYCQPGNIQYGLTSGNLGVSNI